MEMKITNFLKPDQVRLDLAATEKDGAIKEMVNMIRQDKVSDCKELLECLFERERLETTGVGEGIALPHGRTDAVKELLVCFARSAKGIEYKSLDDKPVQLLFLIAAPKNEATRVLQMLAKLSRFLNNPQFRQSLVEASSSEEVISLFAAKEG